MAFTAGFQSSLFEAGVTGLLDTEAGTFKVSTFNIDADATIAWDAGTSLFILNNGTFAENNDSGNAIAELKIKSAHAVGAGETPIDISEVVLLDKSEDFTITVDSDIVTNVTGSENADTVILNKTALQNQTAAAFTFTDFGEGGDNLTLETSHSVVLSTTDGAAIGVSTITSGTDAVTLGAGSKLTTATLEAGATNFIDWKLGEADVLAEGSKIAADVNFTDGAGVEKLNFTQTSGSVVYNGSAADVDELTAVVSGGKLFVNSTEGKGDLLKSVTVSNEGTFNLGTGNEKETTLSAGKGSEITSVTVLNGGLTAQEGSSKLNLKDVKVTLDSTIDTTKVSGSNVSLEISEIADTKTLTHTVSQNGDAAVDIATGIAGTYIATDEKGTGSVSLKAGTGVILTADATDGVLVNTEESEINDWNITGVTGAVNITGTKSNDTVSIGFATGNEATGTINFDKGNDDITITDVAGKGSIAGGAGNDSYDLAELDNSQTATVVVTDFGDINKRGQEISSDYGADIIKIGSELSSNDLKKIKLIASSDDDTKVSAVIKGVEFNLGEAADTKYVVINDGTEDKICAIGADGATMLGAYEETDSDATSPSYNVVDNESTDISFEEGTVDKDGNPVTGSYDADTDGTKGSTVSETFNTFEATKGIERKYLHVGEGTNIDGTVKMGANPTNYLIMDQGASGTLTVDLGGSNAVVGVVDKSADLSKMEINNWNSTKDTLVVGDIDLSNYIVDGKAAKGLVDAETGLYGEDIVTKAGTFGATAKSGLWQTRFREGTTNAAGTAIESVNYEVMLAVGSSEAAVADFTKSTTPVVALVDNNDTVKDAVKGSAGNDFFRGGNGDSLDGGKGDDVFYTTGKKTFVRLATSGEGADTINGVNSSLSRQTFVMANDKDAKDFVLTGFVADEKTATYNLTVKDNSSSTGSAFLKTDADENNYVLTKVKDVDGTFDTFIANTGAAANTVKVQTNEDLQQDDYGLYVGVKDGKGTLDFGDLTKKNIFLGHSANAGEEWGDKSMYSNINHVKSSTVGQSLVFGGSGSKVTLEAGGADDSLWGGAGGTADSLVGNANYRTNFGTTNGSGRDTVDAFSYGANAAEDGAITDVVYFVDGVNYINVNNKQLIVGSSKDDNLTFINAQKSNTKEINYSLGLGGQIFTALADLTENGSANMAFDTNDQLYLGQGSKSTVTFSDEEVVKFGFESQYSGMNVGNLNAKGAAVGSIINGQANMDQSIVGSANGASSICGGFGDGFAGSSKDTLVGGGVGETTFFVGKDMGNDVITNVTDGDTIVFLNTKVSDITFSIDSDKNATAKIAGGATISVKANDSVKFADTSKITAQFTDGTYVFNGATWEPQANA